MDKVAELKATGLLNCRFGLKKDEVPEGLQDEVGLLVHTATDKGINLLRSGVFTTVLAPSTVDTLVKSIFKYEGYLYNIRGWPQEQLSLSAYSSMGPFFDYIEFLGQRVVRWLS